MTRNQKFILSGLFFIFFLIFTYWNHFDNGFYFDDSHTISNNEAIRSLDNISSFFLDATTFSSLPANQAYRPMVTLLNAISYNLGGGLDPIWFHIHMFFWYIVLLIALFFFINGLLNKILPSSSNDYFSLAAAAFYGFHTANAETINYLISISDSFSTLCVITTLLLYQIPQTKKLHLYLAPMIIGIYSKQTGIMVLPLLFLYILLFEEQWQPFESIKNQTRKIVKTFKISFVSFFVGINLFLFNQLLFTPASTLSSNTGVSKFQYFYTQFYIVLHYLRNFILPTQLSADPDFELMPSFFNMRVLAGLVVITGMIILAIFSFRKKETALIGFGICWFFIALLPTSSFVPLFQIANDHRTFFPYIGLVIAIVATVKFLYLKYQNSISKMMKITAIGIFLVIIGGFAYGTHQRNEVWANSESLWHDVTIKSPKNGRGLMNYGITQMEKGHYDRALEYYNRAMKIVPYYSYLHINMAILKNAMKAPTSEVEPYFVNAMSYDPGNPECYYCYANWLQKNDRTQEALNLLITGMQLSPSHIRMRNLYQNINNSENLTSKKQIIENDQIPKGLSADQYLNLSFDFYKKGEFEACIMICQHVIIMNPNSAIAYNNICSAYIRLNRINDAIKACEMAINLDPGFTLARNNLVWAKSLK